MFSAKNIKNALYLLLFALVFLAIGYLFGFNSTYEHTTIDEIKHELDTSAKQQQDSIDRVGKVQIGIGGVKDRINNSAGKLKSNDTIFAECQQIIRELCEREQRKNP